MKTVERILEAKKKVVTVLADVRRRSEYHENSRLIVTAALQQRLLEGMLVGLNWVLDNPNGSTLQDLVDGRSVV